MKHAGAATLDALSALLADLRSRSPLREKKTGVFYLRSRAFLHFHEDPAGIFADVRLGEDFTRMRVTTPRERRALLAAVDAHLSASVRP
jgi:hypothetical protein